MDPSSRIAFLRQLAPNGDLEGLETLRKLRERELPPALEGTTESVGGADGFFESARSVLETPDETSAAQLDLLEALIIPEERPVYLVSYGDYPPTSCLDGALETGAARKNVRRALPAVGRLNLSDAYRVPYGGTAFLVGEGLMMTNRHVAAMFTSGVGRAITYAPGAAAVDLLKEHQRRDARVLTVKRVVMVHPWFDMSLLEVEGDLDGIPALLLSVRPPQDAAGRAVCAIGYPAFDYRNNGAVQTKLFDGVFEVKRIMPGLARPTREVDSFDHALTVMTHDASTLGGASGSCVVDVEDGTVLGLHFGGVYRDANFAVSGYDLASDPRVVDAGVRFADKVQRSGARPWEDRWSMIEAPGPQSPAGPALALSGTAGTTLDVEIPIRLRIDIGGVRVMTAPAAVADAPAPAGRTPEEDEELARAEYAETSGLTEDIGGLETPSAALPRSAVRLIADEESPSLRHIGTARSDTPFRFDAAVLERLVRLNRFDAGLDLWGGSVVLFALRGCRLAGDTDFFAPERDLEDRLGFATDGARQPGALPLWGSTNGFVTSASLVEDTITHVLPRCLLGVWRRDTREFALVRGTTTPNWDYSAQAILHRNGHDGKQGDANLMLPGLYRYAVGSHKSIPDAFRLQEDSIGAVRPAASNKSEICYTVRDRYWSELVSQDNMHPAAARDGSAQKYIFHYSAGCSTIQGWFESSTRLHKGAWSEFRGWAGLKKNQVDTAALGQRFSYLLLTGREAQLAADGASDAAVSRLRFGSRGPDVATLQRALNTVMGSDLTDDGHFGIGTQRVLVEYQQTMGANPGTWDGVLGPAEAAALGVQL